MSKFLSVVSAVSLRSSVLVLAALLAVVSMGCSESEEEAKSEQVAAAVVPLDPTQAHYGKTYAEWAAEWWKAIAEANPTSSCIDVAKDLTGEQCAHGQNPSSPVFYLAGTYGGSITRSKCIVPQGKAIFFPIITTLFDNGGVPQDQIQTDDQLKAIAEKDFGQIDAASLKVMVDGIPITNLGKFGISSAPIEYTLPPEPNIYTCFGASGVLGTYQGYLNGYFVLLPPLPPGKHTVSFFGKKQGSGDPLIIDATYAPLTIE